MELRQLRYFVAVAEALNFNRAAEQLSIAQPALSQQIRNLENELGTSLFNRSQRQIQLTVAGKVLYADARKLIDGADMVIRTTRRAARGEIGRLLLGYAAATSWLLPSVVDKYQQQYPEVELAFEELESSEHIQYLQKEIIDIAIMARPESDENIEKKLVNCTPLILAIPEQHRLSQQPEAIVKWKDMAEEKFIMFARKNHPYLYDQFLNRCLKEGYSPKIIKEANQLETILNVVAAGRGIAPVASYLRDNVQWRGVTFKAIEEPCPTVEVYAMWRAGDFAPVLQNFLSFF